MTKKDLVNKAKRLGMIGFSRYDKESLKDAIRYYEWELKDALNMEKGPAKNVFDYDYRDERGHEMKLDSRGYILRAIANNHDIKEYIFTGEWFDKEEQEQYKALYNEYK